MRQPHALVTLPDVVPRKMYGKRKVCAFRAHKEGLSEARVISHTVDIGALIDVIRYDETDAMNAGSVTKQPMTGQRL